MILFLLAGAHAADVDLASLVEEWGDHAFHHPAVTSGRVDWDAALLEALEARSPRRRRRRMLARLPEEPLPSSGSHPWVEVIHGLPRWHPPTHTDEPLPSEPLRILAVARLWAAIRWTYPYLDEVRDRWHASLPVALDEVRAATTPEAYQDALLALAVQLEDGHVGLEGPRDARTFETRDFAIWSELGAPGPLVLRVAGAPDGLDPGDRIVAIDGMPFEQVAQPYARLASGSTPLGRHAERDRAALEALPGQHRLTLRQPDGTEEDVEVPLGRPGVFPRPHPLPDQPFRRLDDGIVVADLQRLRYEDLDELMAALQGTPGLVLDLRGYPEYMPETLVSCLTDEERPFARIWEVRLETPGAFAERLATVGGGHCPGPDYDGPVTVLIDRITFSRGEWTAMALASVPRVRFVGTPTGGADGNRIGLRLPGRVTVYTSWLGVAWPDGRPTQRVGVVPDRLVEVTAHGLAAGRDEVLEAALEELRAPH